MIKLYPLNQTTLLKDEDSNKFTFYPSKGKRPITSTPLTFNEVKNQDAFCVQIPEGFVVLDFDKPESVELSLKIIRGENLKCRVMQTDRGIHVWFRSSEPWKNFTKELLVCGIEADCKSYGKFSCVCWKTNGKDRPWIVDTPWDEVQLVPAYFYRGTRLTKPFSEMGEGDGRNQSLTEYVWSLQNHRFSPEEITQSYNIINTYVFKTPLPQSELDVITRSDTFKALDTYEKLWFTPDNKFLHNEMAQYLLSLHEIIYQNSSLYIYRDGYYQQISRNLIFQMVHAEHPNSTIRQRTEVLAAMEAELYSQSTHPQDRYTICCANGRLDVRTGELHPHSPGAYDFQQIPTIYDETAQDDLLDKTLKKLFPSDGACELFEEIVGYCLLKFLPFRSAFYMVGDGANGKSTILRLIITMLGERNCSMLAPEQITTDGYMLAELENKLANIGDDIGSFAIKDSASFKKACTGELMVANRKYKDPFNLEPYATLIFAANQMPATWDISYGSDSRRIILPLDARFTPDDPDFDPFIIDKLTTPEVMSALLNRAITGVRRLLKRQRFTMPKVVLDAERQYKKDSSYVGQWVEDEMLELDFFVDKTVQEVRGRFYQWCAENSIRKRPNTTHFGRQLKRLLPELEVQPTTKGGERVRVYAIGTPT